MTIATLVAADRLDESLAREACRRFGATRGAWVDRGSALDLIFDRAVPGTDGWEGVDLIAVAPGPRVRRLLVADMDSTMIGQECIDELADYAGLKPEVAAITERAMQGELDFAAALRERVALLAGLDEDVIARCLAERVRPTLGGATLIATMRSCGARCLLVSGGFTAFAAPVGAMLGFDSVQANVLARQDGRLLGQVEGDVVDAGAKRRALKSERQRLGLDQAATMALGDGANDREMVEAAGWGIAFRAKPALAAVADARLDHHGLDALLWAQGIPRAQWVEA